MSVFLNKLLKWKKNMQPNVYEVKSHWMLRNDYLLVIY